MDSRKFKMVRKINKMAKIKLFDVHHPKNIGQKIEKIFKSGVITEGKYSLKFEKKICEFLKNQNCVLVNSGMLANDLFKI